MKNNLTSRTNTLIFHAKNIIVLHPDCPYIVRQKSFSYFNNQCKKNHFFKLKTPSKDFCKNNKMIFNFQK